MNPAILITVRMKSQRLPLKVLRYIENKPMIEHMIDRLKTATEPSKIILCTSTNPQDDALIDIAEKKQIRWFRGSEDDVLQRLYDAAQKYDIDFMVNVTADNPLVDPEYIDKTIQKFKETSADYITSFDLPIGAFSYGVKIKALEKVIKLKKEHDTEIWGHFFEDNNEFKWEKVEVEEELKDPNMRLTVDEKEDLELIRKVFEHFYKENPKFRLHEVVRFLKQNPEVYNLNQNIVQRIVKKGA